MFADRLDAGRYQNDEPYCFTLRPDPRDTVGTTQQAWLQERIVHRVVYLARAYELPLLSRIPIDQNTESWGYPEAQAISLQRELSFLLEHVNDPLLTEATRKLAELIMELIRRQAGASIEVESPY